MTQPSEEIDAEFRCGMWWSFDLMWRVLRRAGPLLLVALVAGIIGVLVGCGAPTESATSDAAPTTVTISGVGILPPTFATESADRGTSSVVVAQEPPAFDCAAYVNALPYMFGDPGPVREAYAVAASCRGWDAATIDLWQRFFTDDVVMKESGGCWNVRRGGAVMSGVGCEFDKDRFGIDRQGTKSDSGFGQLIRLWYQAGGPLCVEESMCSSEAIIATPWSSMNAALFAIEHDGRGPWCYSADARSYHPLCSSVPRYWP